MKARIFIPITTALFISGVSSAIAGPCTAEIDTLAKRLSAKDAGSGPTVGALGQAQGQTGTSGQHPPTAAMGQETQGKAASPEDVRRQIQGQPTAAQQGATRAPAGPSAMDEAEKALERARWFQVQGKEQECMEAVRQAEQLIGKSQ